MQQGPRHFSSIAMPATTRHVEMKATFLNLISANQFTGMDNEDPYSHLATFYELVGTMGFDVNPVRNKPQNPQQRVVECPKIPKYSNLG